jgi:hypothetical protein
MLFVGLLLIIERNHSITLTLFDTVVTIVGVDQ